MSLSIGDKAPDFTVNDQDGNRYSVKILRDNKLWMTTNLATNIPGSYCYDNKADNCDRYGRLYTWESAQKGCSLLGEGWHLPSIDEWRQLIIQFGGMPDDLMDNRRKAYKALLFGGDAQFNAVLGGGRDLDGSFARLEAHGFYWTTTGNDSTAWFANFGKGSQALYQQTDGEKERAFAVRCVKSVDGLK